MCSQVPQVLPATADKKLEDLISSLCDEDTFRMKNPALTAVVAGRQRTLYMASVPSIERSTRPNLKKTLAGECNLIAALCEIPVSRFENLV